MTMKKYILQISSVFAAALMLTACSDFLDKIPDERTELQTEDNIVDLLKGSYPATNYQYVCELSSDNLIDNNSPHLPSAPWDKQVENHYNYASSARWTDELFRFEPAESATINDGESPGRIWSLWYNSIAATNAALEAIDNLAAKQGITDRKDYDKLSPRLRAVYAESLLLRAYDHFMLANIFSQAYKDEARSSREICLPYVTETETQLVKNYERLNVAEFYKHVIEDMEEGLRYVSDSYYDAPKYHFNTLAAHAFAARVYLFHHDWEKVIEHANVVLGEIGDEATLLRMSMDYSIFADCASADDYGKQWQHPDLNNNLMLLVTYSSYSRIIFGYRYSLAGEGARNALHLYSNSDLWPGWVLNPISIVSGMLFSSSQHDYGYFSCKINEEFEMTDKIAQTGYAHQVIRVFTAMDLLLERAEANVMLGNLDDAGHDLKAYWNNSINSFSDRDKKSYSVEGGPDVVSPGTKLMTDASLKSAFTNTDKKTINNCFDDWNFITTNISSDIVVSEEAVPYMNCINSFRRFEHNFEGLRFFDLKRWGIEWTHYYGLDKDEVTLTGDDLRRAVEAPWEARANGAGSSRAELVSAPTAARFDMSLPRISDVKK